MIRIGYNQSRFLIRKNEGVYFQSKIIFEETEINKALQKEKKFLSKDKEIQNFIKFVLYKTIFPKEIVSKNTVLKYLTEKKNSCCYFS